MDEIIKKVSTASLFEQLAEEASELTHASLKFARILRGENPTPVSKEEAYLHIVEEYSDVIQCALLVSLDIDEEQIKSKNERWIKRLKGENV